MNSLTKSPNAWVLDEMSILITGATGGFGRHLHAWLKCNSAEEIVPVGHRTPAPDSCLHCDLTCPEQIRALIGKVRPRRIYHLAGNFGIDLTQSLAVNAMSARHIFDTLLAEQIEARVILIGSAAEYGIVEAEQNPIREEHILRPVSVYGLTKAFQTQLAQFYAYSHGIDVVVARLFNLLASGLAERLFVGRIERMIERVRTGEAQSIDLGNLDSHRDYITVDEAIQQLELIAKFGSAGDVYHVASGHPTSVRDLLLTMLEEAGLDSSIVCSGAGGHTGYDVPLIYANIEKTLALKGCR
jgi:nucleoside-diphosphate-sugar epimerase